MITEGINFINQKSVKLYRVKVDVQTQRILFQIIRSKSKCNSACRLQSFLPELNTISSEFISAIRSKYKVITMNFPCNDFDKNYFKAKLKSQMNQKKIISLESKGFQKFLVIGLKQNSQGFFHFGFIDSKLLIQRILYSSIEVLQQEILRDITLDSQKLIEYLNSKSEVQSVQRYSLTPTKASNSLNFNSEFEKNRIDSSNTSTNCSFSLKKKLSKDEKHDMKITKQIQKFELNEEGMEIHKFLNEYSDKIQVPEVNSQMIDRIPMLLQICLFQGILKNIGKISSFPAYFKRFMRQFLNSQSGSSHNFLSRHESSEKNILNQLCAPEYRINPIEDNHQFRFLDEMGLEYNFDQQHNSGNSFSQNGQYNNSNQRSNSQNSHQNNHITTQNNLYQFSLKQQDLSEEAKELMFKIRRTLQKQNLKIRSLQSMAIKFIECRDNNELHLGLTPQDIIKMKIHVGKYYIQVIYPLYMRQLERYQSKYSHHSFQKKVKVMVDSIKARIESNYENIPSLRQIQRFQQTLRLQQFCKHLNDKSIIQQCYKVNIQLNQSTIIRTIIKFSKQGGCVFISVDDLDHLYDALIILSRFQEISCQKLKKQIIRIQPQRILQGTIEKQTNSFQQIGKRIEQVMIKDQKDYLTLFYEQSSGNKKLLILIKVLRFSNVDGLITLKFKLNVIFGKSDYDITEPYSFRIDSRLEDYEEDMEIQQ